MLLSVATLASPLSTAVVASPLPVASGATHIHLMPAAIPPRPEPDPTPIPTDDARENKTWGEITIAQPKIWQYERVNSLLDGLLRDVEGVSLTDLTSLNPNATNGAAVKFVQSMLEIGVQYNQGAAETNKLALQNYATSQSIASTQIAANQVYLEQLNRQRSSLSSQLIAAMDLNSTLQRDLATRTDTTSDSYKSLVTQQQAAANQVTSLQSDLTAINSQITAASTTTMPAPPALTPTNGGTAPESANTFGSFLGNLPTDLTKSVVSQLQSPSFPATKQLDNFITVLYERLAREISVLQDDVMRDPDNVPFLVQFDVGLYPSHDAKNRVGVVEFTMDCDGCKVYSVYPGQSSYNLANYEGTSKRYSLWGALQTLFGFGISADYRRQTDTLHGDLVQSVYTSGFEEGADSPDRTGHERAQRFGWYYGASPFEELVTPGIRSTFAIVSIPRSRIKNCMEDPSEKNREAPQYSAPIPGPKWKCDEFESLTGRTDDLGATTVSLKVTAHADWVPRHDPEPYWRSLSHFGNGPGKHGITRYLKVVLPGTDSIKLTPDLVFRERERLHVLGMEYNPVYYVPKSNAKDTSSSSKDVPPPGTASVTAAGAGTGTTTVSVSGAGTASATTSGTTGTTATATATSPSTPSKSASGADALTGCKQGECAAILVKLAEPLDPNLVVSVNGLPLRRVRDWRGRATSVLPPAQSASDVISPASNSGSAGKLTSLENAPSAALLEADLPGPDTWMEVDSHRLLLSISQAHAGDRDEFPTIQIIDPTKRALFLPFELDTGFSELIMNGFHFPTRNGQQLRDYLYNHLRNDTPLLVSGHAADLHPAGPYASETFLPLFLPQRPPQPIYAYLGETGVQLLIGMESTESSKADNGTAKTWLSGKTQVILEDRYLDLAWSLDCYPQGAMLVCDVPRRTIQNAYSIVQDVCFSSLLYPCPSLAEVANDFPSISSLQVWVEQYDPDGDNYFYSSVPARLGRFPVQSEDTRLPEPSAGPPPGPDVGFIPWHYAEVHSDYVKAEECNYPEFPPTSSQSLRILGRDIPPGSKTQWLAPDANDSTCKSVQLPTIALTYTDVVLEYPPTTPHIPVPPPPGPVADPCPHQSLANPHPSICMPESLLASQFRPSFDQPRVLAHASTAGAYAIDRWHVEIPAWRVHCDDSPDLPRLASGSKEGWRFGTEAGDPKAVRRLDAPSAVCTDTADADWQEASRTGQIRLVFDITKADNLEDLLSKNPIRLFRNNGLVKVTTLPDLRPALLPTKLTVVSTGKNQFELTGAKVEAIDAVTLQGPDGVIGPLKAAVGAGVALVSITQVTKSAAGPTGPAKIAAPKTPPAVNANSTVTVSGQNFGWEQGTVALTKPKAAQLTVTCWSNTSIQFTIPEGLPDGAMSVDVTFPSAPSKPQKFDFKQDASTDPATAPKCGPSPGIYTVVPLVALGSDRYLPLDVTDAKGNPLTYTVPDQTKDTSNTNNGSASEGPTTTVTITKKVTTTPAPKASPPNAPTQKAPPATRPGQAN